MVEPYGMMLLGRQTQQRSSVGFSFAHF